MQLSPFRPDPTMLFFFELALFTLIMLTLALGELVSRGLALGVWLTCAAASLAGYVVVGRQRPTGRTELDEKWRRVLLYNWRRTNALLVLGALVVGIWYWLGMARP